MQSSRWALTLAIPHEVKPVLGLMKVRAHTRYLGAKFWEGRLGEYDLVLAQTGIGLHRAGASAAFLMEHFSVTHLISSGYCGGLREGMKTGDAILAQQVVSTSFKEAALTSDSELLQQAEHALADLHISSQKGSLISSPKAVLKIPEKRTLFTQSQATAVDMESYAILKAVQASGKKIASVTVRFVVDGPLDELIDTEGFLDEESRVRPVKLAQEVWRRPRILRELPALEKKASRARAHLTAFCRRFFGVEENR